MAAPILNSTLHVQAVLRRAKREDDPRAYLTTLFDAAYEAVKNGDEFITSASTEGSGSSAERGMTATQLLEIYEAALCVLDAEDEAAEAGGRVPGSVRHADFSNFPCTLG